MTDTEKPKSTARLGLEIAGITIVGVFLAGVIAGYLDAQGTAAQTRSIAALAMIGATLAVIVIRSWRFKAVATKLTERQRNYWLSFAIAVMVGVVLGLGIQFDAFGQTGADPFGPISPLTGYSLSALWVIGMGGSLIFYHRGVDDHEERAWLWAGLAGWYAFILPTPLWLVLARADVVPQVNIVFLLIFSMLVNAIVWLWLKFR